MNQNIRPLIVIFLMLATSPLFSQSQAILDIRAQYKEAKTYKENQDGLEFESEVTRVELNRNIPGMGPCATTISFYGYEEFEEEEASDPWGNDGKKVLLFVEIKYNLSAPQVLVEYLFDKKNQRVIFFYKKDEYNNTEQRFYYDENGLIRTIFTTMNESGESEKTTLDKNWGRKELKIAEDILENGLSYLKMFHQLYQIEKIEK